MSSSLEGKGPGASPAPNPVPILGLVHKPWSRRRFILKNAERAAVLGLGCAVLAATARLAQPGRPLAAELLAGVTILIWLVSYAVRFRRTGKALGVRWNQENVAAVELMRKGEPARAARELERLVFEADQAAYPVNHALYLFNLALVWLSLGHLQAAKDELIAIYQSKWLAKKLAVADQVGIVCALLGELDQAAEWQRIAIPLATAKPVQLLPLETLLLARRGDFLACAARFAAAWAAAESAFTGRDLKRLRVIRALAMERSGAPPEEVDRMLDAARPVPPELLSGHRKGWPELDAFVSAHPLG